MPTPNPVVRPTWSEYFMEFAKVAATRSTCRRTNDGVGAVLVKDRQLLATGYNGSSPGDLHCIDAGCDMVDGHCQRTVHAEINALAQAARHGQSVEEATLYSTLSPCWTCFRTLHAAGVCRFVALLPYQHADHRSRVESFATLRGVQVMTLADAISLDKRVENRWDWVKQGPGVKG